MLTKFPRTKLAIIGASVLATVAIWAALAWPDWNAGATAQDASATAGALSTFSASEAAVTTGAPPPPPQTPVIIRRVYIVTQSSASAPPPAAAPPSQSSQLLPSSSAPGQSQRPITRSRGS